MFFLRKYVLISDKFKQPLTSSFFQPFLSRQIKLKNQQNFHSAKKGKCTINSKFIYPITILTNIKGYFMDITAVVVLVTGSGLF